jgi:D-sedoheptulose 7-phosphate isomerase
MRELAGDSIGEAADVFRGLADEEVLDFLESAARLVADSLAAGGKVLLFGNGGSAADAQHVAAELVGRFEKERDALAAVALTTDTSILTAVANDYGYDRVFARQVEALAAEGDVVIAFSTSGESANVVAGVDAARQRGARSIAFTGEAGGRLADAADVAVRVRSGRTARIQEGHILLSHVLCELVEATLAAG